MRLNPPARRWRSRAGWCIFLAQRAHTSSRLRVINREGGTIMTASKGFVVPAGGGRHVGDNEPDRFSHLKLLTDQTNGSIMMFEQAVPAGTKSWFHLHHHSDEVAWVLAGEITFKIGDDVTVGGPGTCAFMPRNVPHAWKNSGSTPGRVLFLYTPAIAGRFVERMMEGPKSQEERDKQLKEYGWELLGPNPL
jgi:quercetin dioxygenase-like cupin family protein